ncbi:MAG: ankyrin repeat domain-containing protein [Candidatus Xenobiia bacterium LiM19]
MCLNCIECNRKIRFHRIRGKPVSAKAATIRKSITAFVFLIIVFFAFSPECAFAGAIQDAVRRGDLQGVKAVIKEDPSWILYKSADGWTLLHWASKRMQTDVAEYLLSKGADVNAGTDANETPLSLAVERGMPGKWGVLDIDVPRRKKMIDLLISYGAGINSLNESIAVNGIELFSTLLKNNPATMDNISIYNSALNSAACWGSARIMSFLLKNRKLALNSVDLEKPLETASKLGYKDIVKLLISSGAGVNSNCDRVCTPLFNAVVFGNGRLIVPYYDPRSELYNSIQPEHGAQRCTPHSDCSLSPPLRTEAWRLSGEAHRSI